MRSIFQLLLWGGLLASRAAYADPGDDPVERDELEEEMNNPTTSSSIKLDVSVSFPQAELFGVKLVNNHMTEALVSLTNREPTSAVNLHFIGGSLWSIPAPDQTSRVLRNFTVTKYEAVVLPGESESFSYKFGTVMLPQEVMLSLVALVTNEQEEMFTVNAFNGTVSIVEAPTSIFDPQIIFLYLIMAALFMGTSYFIYNTWVTTLFPQQQKKRVGGKDSSRPKTPKSSKKGDATGEISVGGGDGPAVTSGAAAYDASWIPAHHLQRPEAKRARSGTPSSAKTKKAA